MCGIVGAIAHRNVSNILITGLKRLEYRGYDSAGVALLNDQGLLRVRRQGKVAALEAAVRELEHRDGRVEGADRAAEVVRPVPPAGFPGDGVFLSAAGSPDAGLAREQWRCQAATKTQGFQTA